jgi:hypothetical protein
VLVREPSGWTQQAYLKSATPQSNSDFGMALSLSGDTVVIGAATEKVGGVQTGAAHVFVRSGSTWTEQAVLTASNAGPQDYFGYAVAISGDTIVVGAFGEDSAAVGVNGDQTSNAMIASGAAYVFVRSGTSWSQQAYLKASNTGWGDRFGNSVAIDTDTIVVVASDEGSAATGVNGDQANNDATKAGAAYVFTRNGTAWSQDAYLKASNTETFDHFGISVSISGDTVAVGAHSEEGGSAGVNGDQSDNSLVNAGAVYVFVREGGRWSQQAYVKSSNPDKSDAFGLSVEADHDLLLVGAHGESSKACGVGGNQADNTEKNSGAAYLFRRTGGSWSQIAYVKSSFTSPGARFGGSVALSGTWCAIGAQSEVGDSAGVNGNQTALHTGISGAVYAFDLDPAPWTDLTFGLAGTAGVPQLAGDGPLTAGSSNTLQLTSAQPSANGVLAVGTVQLVVFFKHGTFVPDPLFLLPLQTDAQGELSLPFTWPVGIPAGTALYLQCWIEDAGGPVGYAASNALEAIAH